MQVSRDRIRTTHVGSLPRPPELLAMLRDQNARKPVDPARFSELVRSAVFDVVLRQKRTGIDIVNDGELGRVDYTVYIADRLNGLTGESTPLTLAKSEFPEWPQIMASLLPSNLRHPACDGPLSWSDFSAVERDLALLNEAAAASGAEERFMTSVSPGQIARFLQNQHYPSEDAYLEALAEVMKREYEAIHAAGVVLQLDCPDLAFGYEYAGGDQSYPAFRRVVARHIEVLNAATENIPADRLRMHVCWSSTGGPHHRDIELKEIAGELIKARPQAIVLAGANPRHEHEWRVWSSIKLPDDKLLVPGVIDTTTNFIEHPEVVADRIERYANVVGRERVIAGCDCGFGTFADRVQVDREIVWRKLESLVRGAEIATSRLWPN